MHKLSDALARYGDGPVVLTEDSAITVAELSRRADALIAMVYICCAAIQIELPHR